MENGENNFSGNTKSFDRSNYMFSLGVKVRNMKMDFNTGGTWRRVGNEHYLMKMYEFRDGGTIFT